MKAIHNKHNTSVINIELYLICQRYYNESNSQPMIANDVAVTAVFDISKKVQAESRSKLA